MSLNQLNEDLNDAFESYFPERGLLREVPYRAASLALLLGLHLRRRLFGGRVLANERIVEYPQVLRWIRPGGRVLDVGCVSSRLPIQLASLGYAVHGIDLRPYAYRHPNLRFEQTDLFRWSVGQPFDIVLLVSTLEHLGLGAYGDEARPDADREAVERLGRWLVPGGQLLVSVPFGRAGVTPKHRIYDAGRLADLFADFARVGEAYFERVEGGWRPSSAESLREVASPALPTSGVAVLDLCKR